MYQINYRYFSSGRKILQQESGRFTKNPVFFTTLSAITFSLSRTLQSLLRKGEIKKRQSRYINTKTISLHKNFFDNKNDLKTGPYHSFIHSTVIMLIVHLDSTGKTVPKQFCLFLIKMLYKPEAEDIKNLKLLDFYITQIFLYQTFCDSKI